MTNLVDELVNLLDLETIELNLFRGESCDVGGRSVFGGQVISQSLVAAYRTLEEQRQCHSLHAYFLRPGDINTPIIYEVDRIRDGGSFTTRRV
ncbi:MAG: acyl-CoA thioesterase, partial [Ketobacter sp.]